MKKNGNAKVIELCRKGNKAAFEHLINKYQALIYWTIKRFENDSSINFDKANFVERDDIAHNVILKLVDFVHRVEQSERIGGWISKTTYYECLAAARKWRERASDLVVDEQIEIPDLWSEKQIKLFELRYVLDVARQELRKKCQELLHYLFDKEYSQAEIKEEMGISKGSIGPTQKRCLEKLRSIVESFGLDLSDF